MLTRVQRLRRLVEDTAAGMGLMEVVTYGLVPPGAGETLGVAEEDVVRLANPMTVDHAELRTSMVPSHLEVARRNIAAGTGDVAIFEIGRTFFAATPGEIGTDGLPVFARERDALGVLVSGTYGGARWDSPGVPADIHAAVGLAVAIGGAVGVTVVTAPLPNPPAWLHPGRAAELRTAGGGVIGWIGSLHPRFAREAGVEQDVHAFQIDLAALDAARPATPKFAAYSEFPPVLEDIAVVLADTVNAGDVLRAVRTAGGELVERAQVFDRYVGANIPEGHHSLAIQLTYRAPDRTLTAAETAEIRANVVAALEHEFDAKLRA
jgi:phenylalanyl-tRNA synthetase beta chain